MDNSLKIFENKEFGNVRVLMDVNDEVWFVGKDVSTTLGYTKLDAMYRIVRDKNKQKINPHNPESIANAGFPLNRGVQIESNENIKRLVLINEAGLYQAIFGSTLPSALSFQDWVTDEVLPQIRKTGSYSVQHQLPTSYKEALLQLVEQLDKTEMLELENKEKDITIKHKEDVIDALVEDISLADKRQRISQIVRFKSTNHSERYNLLYSEFEKKHHMNLNTRMKSTKAQEIKPKIQNKMDYIDRGLNQISDLYDIACVLFETDVDLLKKSWDGTREAQVS